MRNFLLTTCLGAVAAFAAGAAHANDELIKMSQNPKEWVMPTGNYANHRYSSLKQITADNVGKLQAVWNLAARKRWVAEFPELPRIKVPKSIPTGRAYTADDVGKLIRRAKHRRGLTGGKHLELVGRARQREPAPEIDPAGHGHEHRVGERDQPVRIRDHARK